MKNNLIKLVAFMALAVIANADIEQVYNKSATGTASATVFIPAGSGVCQINDLTWKVDSGATTAHVALYIGQQAYVITSATASAASVLWISNTNTNIATDDFVIFVDADTGDMFLRQVRAASTTSITVGQSIAVTTTTSDIVWGCFPRLVKPIAPLSTQTTGLDMSSIWLPAGAPTAIAVDGNTTSCNIFVSATRGISRK